MARGEYWNEEIEATPAHARRRLENERLREQIAYNHRTSAFYAAKFDATGVRPSDIRCVDDLARIPFMEKHELAASQEPDVILMDIQMPRLDGVEAATRIKQGPHSTAVLMLTGSNAAADVARAREAGAAGYVTKDRIASELIDSIVEVSAK